MDAHGRAGGRGPDARRGPDPPGLRRGGDPADAVEGLDLLPADPSLGGVNVALAQELGRDTRLRSALSPLEGRYDYLLFDTGPAFSTILANVLVATAEVIVPLDPGVYAVLGLVELEGVIAEVREAYNPALRLAGLLLTKVARNNVCRDVEGGLRDRFGPLVFTRTIPLAPSSRRRHTRGRRSWTTPRSRPGRSPTRRSSEEVIAHGRARAKSGAGPHLAGVLERATPPRPTPPPTPTGRTSRRPTSRRAEPAAGRGRGAARRKAPRRRPPSPRRQEDQGADDLPARRPVRADPRPAHRRNRTISEYVAAILDRQVPDHRVVRADAGAGRRRVRQGEAFGVGRVTVASVGNSSGAMPALLSQRGRMQPCRPPRSRTPKPESGDLCLVEGGPSPSSLRP